MDHTRLSCLICLNKYSTFFELKNHVQTGQHDRKFKAIFQEEKSHRKAWIPYIAIMNPQYLSQPKVGVSLLTLCSCAESMTFFYLCHVCEEKCDPYRILDHLLSADHCSNYFSYTDPNALGFSWIPSTDKKTIMGPWILKEVKKKGPGTVQLLDLPINLKRELDTLSYSEVMDTLRKNDKLLKVLEAVKTQRMTIQAYQKDGNRKHKLLGMQHLVECIGVGQTDKRCYLCTLCKQTVATNMIISHVLSFDHIHCYFKVQYPNSLLPKENTEERYSASFVNSMLNITKQTLELDEAASNEIKQVSLDPAEFASMNFTSYEEAFQKLESILKEKNGSSLMTDIQPENKLKCCGPSVKSEASLYKLHCQNCSITFGTESEYVKHLLGQKHIRMWEKIKQGGGSQCFEQTVTAKFSLDMYKYFQEGVEENEPAVGVSLVVACVSTRVQVEPIYICFACQNCFPESFLRQHFKSQKHFILTLLYQNPWQLPFAWKSNLDLKVLKAKAWEETKARGPDEMILKVFDIPYSVFQCLIPPSYIKAMEKLVLFHTSLRNKVPQCETYSRLQQNERFPLLGKQFMVIHACVEVDTAAKVGFLCLLCEEEMSDDEFYAHVFSWKHVATFLNRFHPGTLSGKIDAATLLDLAKQAACLHPTSNEQVIHLDTPISKCSFEKVLQILAAAKRRHGAGPLEPTIAPKHKLFPRQSQKELSNNTMRDNTQEIKTCSMKSDDNPKDGANKETPMPCGAEPEIAKICPDEVQNTFKVTCQRIKEEITEETKMEMKMDKKKEMVQEHIMRKISEIPQSCQNTVSRDRGAETEQERRETSKVVPIPRNVVFNKSIRKGPNGLSDDSPDVTSPSEDAKAHKRQRFSPEEDKPFGESQNIQCAGLTVTATIGKSENDKLCQKTANTKVSFKKKTNHLWRYVQKTNRPPVIGLSSLLECCCEKQDLPLIYLCKACSVKCNEGCIISHVIGCKHYKNYIMKKEKKKSKVRRLAALVEKTEGCGEVQVLNLNENIYQLISKHQFNLAIQTVKEFQAQQEGKRVFLSAPALLDTRPVHTSGHVYSHSEDNLQVVDMDIDSNSETKLFSVTTPMSSPKEVPPESTADVKITNSKDSDHTHHCPSDPRSAAEDGSSVHMSKRRTTMARLHCYSTENNSENKITRNAAASSLGKTTYKCASATDGTAGSITKLTSAHTRSSAPTISPAPTSSWSTDGINCTRTAVKAKTSAPASTQATQNVREANPPSAPLAAPTVSFSLGHGSPSMEPSQTHSMKTKSKENKVGFNELIIVICEKRQQVYCKLCCKRVKESCHTSTFTHQSKYVKKLYGPNTETSQFEKIISHLAEAEKIGTRKDQISSRSVEVQNDVYKELATLRDDKAIKKLKDILKQKALQVPSVSTSDTAEVKVVGSSEVQSPDDGICMPLNQTSGPSERNQPVQENIRVTCSPCSSELKSNGEADHSDEAPSWPEKSPGSSDLTPDQVQPCLILKRDPDPIPLPFEEADTTVSVSVKQERFDPYFDAQAHIEVTPAIQSPVPVEKPHDCSDSVATASEPTHTSLVPSVKQEPHSLDVLRTEQKHEPGPSLTAEHVPAFGPGPERHSTSQVLPGMSEGDRNQRCMEGLDSEPIIGLGFVWKCRGTSGNSFYLCESCEEMFSTSHISHASSPNHWFKYIRWQYPSFVKYWDEDFPPEVKLKALRRAALGLSQRESYYNITVQDVLLGPELYEHVHRAPFSEALQITKNIKEGENRSVLSLPGSTPPASANNPEARKKADSHEEMVKAGHVNGSKHRKVSGPLDESSVSSKVDRFIFPLQGTSISGETHGSHISPPVSSQQKYFPKLQKKRTEVNSESQFFRTTSPETFQTPSFSASDKFVPNRKRPADASTQTSSQNLQQ